jgi:hypothetical protein
MSRKHMVILGVVGLAIFSLILRTHKTQPARTINPAPPITTPEPAASPTVAMPVPTTVKRAAKNPRQHSQEHGNNASKPVSKPTSKPKASPKPVAINSRESSEANGNLVPELKSKLKTIVTLYASWPGSTPKQKLLNELKQQEPFITAGAVSKIETEWQNTPLGTFKLKVKGVDLSAGLVSQPHNPSNGVVTAYAVLEKTFTPVSGSPSSQTASQPYTVRMRIINRSWRVVGLSVQS